MRRYHSHHLSYFLLFSLSCGLANVHAQAWDPTGRDNLAHELADLLSSEALCNLSYDQDAIRDFVNKNVPADDRQFSRDLIMYTELSKFTLEHLSPSSKTAHCTQIARVARSYNFIK